MLHHNAVLSNNLIAGYLGGYAVLIKALLPDITIGTNGRDDYASIYDAVCHELAHASHFAQVGTSYWNPYISYMLTSYVLSGGMTYGDGMGENAGLCEVGEMWAYYLESKIYKERYGGGFPTFGTSYWFYPQIFRFLDERGMSVASMFSVLKSDVTSRQALKEALMTSYPDKRSIIEQVFSRY